MSNDLPNWERTHFQSVGGHAFLLYVIYGQFPEEIKISGSKYRCAGLPAECDLRRVGRSASEPLPFTEAEYGQVIKDAALFARTGEAPECSLLQCEIPDPSNLNYLRDIIGMITYLVDNGGFAVADPQQFELYDAARWHREIFDSGTPNVLRHVKLLYSDEPDGRWYHTRGMRKFARPDLSVTGVPKEYFNPVIEMCNRFIELQALGGWIPEEQEIRMKSIPPGLCCHHAGSLEDPDFNNEHVEIQWPRSR